MKELKINRFFLDEVFQNEIIYCEDLYDVDIIFSFIDMNEFFDGVYINTYFKQIESN